MNTRFTHRSRQPRIISICLLGIPFLGLTGCDTTGRAAFDVPVFAGPLSPISSFAAGDGTMLTLDDAWISLTHLTLEAPPVEASLLPPVFQDLLTPLSPLSVAHAHPGHDFSGDVAGELTGTFTVDLLSSAREVGTAHCYEGDYATARLVLDGASDGTGKPIARLGGVALLTNGASVPFDFSMALYHEITGIPFVYTLNAQTPPAAVNITVDVPALLSYVDWSTPDGDGDGLLTLEDGKLANTAPFGLVATPAYGISIP